MLSIALIACLSGTAAAADNKWEDTAKDAWLDGKAEATLLFNGNLNSFNIGTDVKMGTVVLTGKVNNDVEKELAEELIMGIEGVVTVDNRLSVLNEGMEVADVDDEERSTFTDAKIVTVVKSRFLFNSEVSGTNINVDVENGVVTLRGEVKTDEERELAVAIAKNASDVKKVNNELTIMSETKSMPKT
jgi:osmotically-inducible protein OsmY